MTIMKNTTIKTNDNVKPGTIAEVSGFPIRKTERSETLRVAIEEGNYESGKGIVIDFPRETTRVKLGDTVYYEGGTATHRPNFKFRAPVANRTESVKKTVAAQLKAAIVGNTPVGWPNPSRRAQHSVRVGVR